MRRLNKRLAALIQLLALLGALAHNNHALGMSVPAVIESGRAIGWQTMPTILMRIKPPRFPAQQKRWLSLDLSARAKVPCVSN